MGGGRDTEAGSDEIYAMRTTDQRTELGGREGVDMAGFRNNQQKDLCPGQNAELECFLHDATLALTERELASVPVRDKLDRSPPTAESKLLCATR